MARLPGFPDPPSHQCWGHGGDNILLKFSALGGFQWRNPPKTGKWAIVRGTKEDPNAVVFQLDPDQPQGIFSFQQADENILLFLDRERRQLVGNSRFS